MAKIFVFCTLAALVVIASSKSLSYQEETCYDCTDDIGAGEVHKQQNRARDAPQVINAVTGLLKGILVPTWDGIVQVNRDKMNAGRPGPIYIGPGRNNVNRVMFSNDGSWMKQTRLREGYDDDNSGESIDSLRRSFNYNSQNNNYANNGYDDDNSGESIDSLRRSFNYNSQRNNYARNGYDDDNSGESINSLRRSFNQRSQRNNYYSNGY